MKNEKKYKYLVSTRCFTYNHARYIEDALRGFAIQETSYPVVFCIVDDASTDGEPEVLRHWAEDNLDYDTGESHWKNLPYGELTEASLKGKPLITFVILLLKENYYQKGLGYKKLEYIAEWNENSAYNALCEGDDFWTDKLKIRKQVSVLEKYRTIGMCYTKCRYYYQNELKYAKKSWGGKAESFEKMLISNPVPTASVMIRHGLIERYNSEIQPKNRGWMLGDYPVWIWISKEYGVKFLNQETCVYRVLEHSASWRDDKKKREAFLSSVTSIQQFFANKYGRGELVPKDKLERALFMDAFDNHDFEGVIRYYSQLEAPGLKKVIKYLLSLLFLKIQKLKYLIR